MTYFGLADEFIDEFRDSPPGGMNHAGELETSLLMHFRPGLVREEAVDGNRLEEPYTHAYDDMFAGGPLSVHRLEEEYSEIRAVGDPELASAEKGAAIFERLGDELETLFHEAHHQNR